jgi:hypothetical protein
LTKLMLATALLTALSVPATASVSKIPTKLEYRHGNYVAGKPSKWSKTEGRTYSDPYWQPCEYFSEDFKNSCDERYADRLRAFEARSRYGPSE